MIFSTHLILPATLLAQDPALLGPLAHVLADRLDEAVALDGLLFGFLRDVGGGLDVLLFGFLRDVGAGLVFGFLV